MSYSIGSETHLWNYGKTQTITFIVTEDCNLRCSYCYVVHKSNLRRMNFEVAKKFIDYYLNSPDFDRTEAVVLDFIGGEPLLEVELIEKIVDYFKVETFKRKEMLYWNYRINISTNGVNYGSDSIQNFVKRNRNKLQIGITLDGTKEKHDLNRKKINGEGSYDDILKNIPLWLTEFLGSTKVTFASKDLIYLKDSIIKLWDMGILDVSANVVYENVWNEGDEKILQRQLIELADYIVDNKIYEKEGYSCSFFQDSIGGFHTEETLNQLHCGAGQMIAVGVDGKIFPCLRFASYSLTKNNEYIIGNVDDGIDKEKIRPFLINSNKALGNEKCLNCPLAANCPYCLGFNYDDSEDETLFYRSTYHCKMHKARVRANEYYFARLFNEHNIVRKNKSLDVQHMYFILDDNHVDFCHYTAKKHKSSDDSNKIMSMKVIKEGLMYCREYFYEPVFLHSENTIEYLKTVTKIHNDYIITNLVPFEFYDETKGLKNIIYVVNSNSVLLVKNNLDNCIYNCEQNNLINLAKDIINLMKYTDRINVNIQNIDKNFPEKIYEEQLSKIVDEIEKVYLKEHKLIEVSILTDLFFDKKPSSCKAGERLFALAPNGKIYICPFSYHQDKNDMIENVHLMKDIKRKEFLKDENQFLCKYCDAYQCKNCKILNKNTTNEYNVSPSFQCRKSNIEKRYSNHLVVRIPNISELYERKYNDDLLDPINRTSNLKNRHSHFTY